MTTDNTDNWWDEPIPPYSGAEWLESHNNDLSEHEYPIAFQLYLDAGADPDAANSLAWGTLEAMSSFGNDWEKRNEIATITERLAELDYWSESENDREPEGFQFTL